MIARSRATQRLLLGARRAQRSPRANPACARNRRARVMLSSNSSQEVETHCPSFICCKMGLEGSCLNCSRMIWRKFILRRVLRPTSAGGHPEGADNPAKLGGPYALENRDNVDG